LTDFQKSSISNLMKIHPVGAKLLHVDEQTQTDRQPNRQP